MAPTGGESGRRHADITMVPNGAERSPDAVWIEASRWEALSPGDRATFPPIAPDFVVELRSAGDSLPTISFMKPTR